MRPLLSVNRYFLRYKWLFLLGILFVTLSNIFAVLSPQVIRNAIDLVSDSLNTYVEAVSETEKQGTLALIRHGLFVFVLTFLGLAILKGLFMFLMRQTIIIMSRHIEYDQKNDLYAHYQVLTPSFYKKNNTGDLMNRVAEDVGRVRQYVGPALMYFLNLLVLFILVIWAMVKVSPSLTLYVLIPLPVLSVSIYYVNNIIEKRSELIQRQLSKLTSIAQETFSGIRVIKAYAQEQKTSQYFEDQSEEYKRRSLGLARVDSMFQPLMILLIGLSTLLTVFIGGQEVMEGRLTAGNIAEFIIYVNMLTWPVTSLGWVVSIIQRAAVSQNRINEFLHTKPDIETPFETNDEMKGRITFEHVSFTYPDTGITALKDLNFDIQVGEKVAIIGRTGSGKSTLAELLVRLYDPQEGRILLDGKPIDRFSLRNLRSAISYVPQDVFLFGDSIRNNILFGVRDNTSTSVEQFAAYASIDNEIQAFKEGYDTLVGERGVTLSGGQKQRISIARAFAKDAPILILDDCLSAVDAHTEHRILDNMEAYLQNKTALIITHRISGMFAYDRILVLDEHRIVESGTHEELLQKGGIYADILATSAKDES